MSIPLPWPFEDEATRSVCTVDDILTGASPILAVSHQVSGGDWRFLTGPKLDLGRAKQASLGELVSLDPTLVAIADLPLGYNATRSAVSEPWLRTASFAANWNDLLSQAYVFTEMQQASLRDNFDLLKWERFDYHPQSAQLVLSQRRSSLTTSTGATATRLVTKANAIGSFSNLSGTWLWAWDNPNFLEETVQMAQQVRKFGKQQGHPQLITSTWAADEVDGWEMATVACLLLGGNGVYRAPHDSGSVYLVLEDPQLLGDA